MQNPLPSRALKVIAALFSALVIVLAFAGPAAADQTLPKASERSTSTSWAFTALGVPADRPAGDGIKVAVVDSGIDADHPAFAGRIAGAANCVGSGGNPARCTDDVIDDNGHGTHIAGIIGARRVGKAPDGVAPGVQLLAVRSLTNTCEGKGQERTCRALGQLGDVVAGVRWATSRDADLINLSIDAGVDLDWKDGDLADAIVDAWRNGAVVVASTGNRSITLTDPDLRSVPMLLVGAVNAEGVKASYSNLPGTARWGLMAPGGEAGGACPEAGVLSTYPREIEAAGTGCLSGTSMAAAYVTGALASLMSNGLDGPTALSHLLTTATPATDDATPAPLANLAAALSTPAAPPTPGLTHGIAGAVDRQESDGSAAVFSASGLPISEWTKTHPIRTRVLGTLAILAGTLLMLGHRRRSGRPWLVGYDAI